METGFPTLAPVSRLHVCAPSVFIVIEISGWFVYGSKSGRASVMTSPVSSGSPLRTPRR